MLHGWFASNSVIPVPQRRLPRLVAALVAVLLALPVPLAGPIAAAQSQSDLERNNARLREAREDLEHTETRRKATMEDLQQIEARRAQIEAELSELNRTLAAAQSRLDAAESRLALTMEELRRAERELDRTRLELARQRRIFNSRVRETYKRGNAGLAVFAMDVEDFNEFARGMAYVQRVMRADRDRITEISSLEREVAAHAEDLEVLRQRQRLLAEAAAGERDQVAILVADQRVLRDQAAAEAEKHRLALRDLESDKASYEALVASLEQESANIEAELRRRAEEERRRREREAAAKPRPARGEADEPAASSGTLRRPYSGPQTSGYGWREHPIYGDRRFHAGVDYAGPTGDEFWAAGDGVVVSAGWRGGYGNTVVIDHGDGLATLYAHASALLVHSGERVERGQPVARIGSTGYSTGPHLHFEVRQDGEPQDPNRYV